MILFFHFICLLAQYIVSSFSKSISKRFGHSDDGNEDVSIFSQSSDFLQNKKWYTKQPVYEDGSLKFFPPVYVQRYETVALILQDSAFNGKITKIADFGCAELGFFMYLKNIDGVREVLEVDIDKEIIERNLFKAAPLTSEYLISNSKNKPFDVYVLVGSIADYDDYLLGTDAVVGIELIEHLSTEAFNKMPYNVFHRIKPKLAIFTTPNADFNPLFSNLTSFRHSDHKFEWTRKEFYNWTQEILRDYPEYSVRFYGIGAGPDGTENLGCCSQMAVFQRSEDFEPFSSAREELVGIHNYILIKHFKYPVFVDTRTDEEKIMHEIQNQVLHISALPTYYNYLENESEIPISLLKEYVTELCPDEETFRKILQKNGMNLKMKSGSWFLIYKESDFDSSEKSFEDEDWLNEEVNNTSSNKEDIFEENWDSDEKICFENITNFQSAQSLKPEMTESSLGFYRNLKVECTSDHKEEIKSAPESCNHLLKKHLSHENLNCSSNNNQAKKMKLVKSKIPRKKNTKEVEEDSSFECKQKSPMTFVCSTYKKISKSYSLDSCLENINSNPFEFESYYLDSILGDSVLCRNVSSLSCKKKKHRINSGSSLLSSSLEKAADSGYPFSFSPPDADLTPEQFDELLSENEMMSRSTSASSEVEIIGGNNNRVHHDLFEDVLIVENGDLANNNRDGEGNNVEGLIGQRLINELAAERDPNDNMMFFPEIEGFPPWLLNLGELALHPVYIL